MKKVSAALFVLAASTQSAFAIIIPDDSVVVPEISAMEGAAAIAAVLAIVALVWERRRRAA